MKFIRYSKFNGFDVFGVDLGDLMDSLSNQMLDSGYSGWVGIEYEGTRMAEYEGVAAAKRCLERYL